MLPGGYTIFRGQSAAKAARFPKNRDKLKDNSTFQQDISRSQGISGSLPRTGSFIASQGNNKATIINDNQ
jgi:hypothetical protein